MSNGVCQARIRIYRKGDSHTDQDYRLTPVELRFAMEVLHGAPYARLRLGGTCIWPNAGAREKPDGLALVP